MINVISADEAHLGLNGMKLKFTFFQSLVTCTCNKKLVSVGTGFSSAVSGHSLIEQSL